MHTHTYEHTYAKPYPYEHLRMTGPADLEIHEATTGTSLSMRMSPTTKSIAPLILEWIQKNVSTRTKSRT